MADPEDIVNVSDREEDEQMDESDDPNYVWKGVC